MATCNCIRNIHSTGIFHAYGYCTEAQYQIIFHMKPASSHPYVWSLLPQMGFEESADFFFYRQHLQGYIFFIYSLLDNNVPSCNNKYGTYFRSKCRQCAICLSTIYIPLNTTPATGYGLRFKNPSIEGSIITVD